MATACASCGVKLGFTDRLTGARWCDSCERREKAAAAEAAATRDAVVAHLRSMVEVYVEDEHLSEEEEASLDQTADAAGFATEEWRQVLAPFGNRLWIARFNAGRLLEIPSPQIILKPGEVAHLEVPARLMKEVVHRETVGGYSGFSIPITKGVRFRTGGYRGRSVVVGTSIEVADQGTMTITSQRAVFKGLRQSFEAQFARLIGVNVFDDGIQFHVSNRKTAPLFKVSDGYLVAAAVNAVVQRTEQR